MTLPAFVAERRATVRRTAVAIDQYLLLTGPTAANPPHAAAAVDRSERQTNTVPLHKPWLKIGWKF